LGRWLSPGPAGKLSAKTANPQTWSRYTCLLNNRTKLGALLVLQRGGIVSSGYFRNEE
jgi:hypothetical protein